MKKSDDKSNLLIRIIWSGASIMILTMIHHIYGAIIYETPFRMDITWFAVPVLAIMFLTYFFYYMSEESIYGKIALWVFLIVTFFIAIGTFGFVEGGYNHVVKNILFFGGVEPLTLDKIYPPEYELPNDFWFESSGILQFFVGLYGFIQFIKLKPFRAEIFRLSNNIEQDGIK